MADSPEGRSEGRPRQPPHLSVTNSSSSEVPGGTAIPAPAYARHHCQDFQGLPITVSPRLTAAKVQEVEDGINRFMHQVFLYVSYRFITA